MGLQIESGQGAPFVAGVTSENRLKTSAQIFTQEHQTNHHEGECYSIGAAVTPTGAGDCFLYVKNTRDTDMVVSEVMLRAASDETITFKLNDTGTPIGGTTGTPINRNAGSGNLAAVTSLYGVDITGLSGGSAVMSMFLKGGETSVRIAPLSGFIVPKNHAITGYVSSGAILVMVGMGISFHALGA
jgi:hypothetical protein